MKTRLCHSFLLSFLFLLMVVCTPAWGSHEEPRSRISYRKGIMKAFTSGLTTQGETASVCQFLTRDGNNDSRGGECTFNSHLLLNVDFSVVGGGWGGTMNFDVESRQGPGLTNRRLGDIFGANNDEGRNFTQISEWWYQRDYASGSYFKVGLMDAGADFQVVDNGGEFLNSVFGVIPNLPVPTFPDYAAGAVASVALPKFGYIRLGVTDGAMDDSVSRTETVFDQTFYALELGYVPADQDEDGPHAVYKIGLFKHTGNIPDGNDGAEHGDNHGFYVVADRPLSRKAGIFLQYGDTPDDRTFISKYWGGGVAFTGFHKSRPADAAGVAFGTGRINAYSREQGAGGGETVYEVYYKAQISPAVSIMPDLQWIRNPGGAGEHNLIYGVKVNASF